jgi:hypothetical protein
MNWRRILLIALVGLVAVLALLWFGRARLAAEFASAYFRSHGVTSSVKVGNLGLSGATGRFALGPADAPDISADRIELHFDPLSWIPRVVEVRLVNPVIRAQVDEHGTITLPSLQGWITSLQQQQGKSRFVSDDLAVSLTGLRLLLATPGGAVEVDGDVKLVKNLPVFAALKVRPAAITYQGSSMTLTAASLRYDSDNAALTARFSAHNGTASVSGAKLSLDIANPQWSSAIVTTPLLRLKLSADALVASASLRAPTLDLTARNVTMAGDDLKADVSLSGGLGYDPGALAAIRGLDPKLAKAVIANFGRLQVSWAGHVARQGGKTGITSSAPLLLGGARGAKLRADLSVVSASSDRVTAGIDAALSGGGLPTAKLSLHDLVWRDGGFTAKAALSSRFNFAMLHGASIAVSGPASLKDGKLSFALAACSRVSLSAFHTTSDLARSVRLNLCPASGPLFTADSEGWSFHGSARSAVATLPLTNTQLADGAAALTFEGQGSVVHGTVAVSNVRMSDLASAHRFQPLLGRGQITLANWVWKGRIAVSDVHKNMLGDVSFTHATSTGKGVAHVSAPKLTFAPDKLQPQDISPLLVALRRAEGNARFEGDIDWTRTQINSSGTLALDSLDFMTPLGKAHAVKTDIHFQSLLPPITAPNQQITISRIDWTLPFSAVDLRFAVGDGAVKVRSLDLDIAEGHAALGALTIDLANPGNIAGAVQFKSIALNSLIAASNLGTKVKMEGKISGSVPFALTSEGFRIRDGHVTADGTGRLSFDRSMWAQAGPAANAVQDFAYQAMEHLAFDTLSADLNSVPKGRLQVVFKIKGKSDPPKPQTADVAISDILDGTALQKPIPLPSGTPIDLTLDTSLNFDELLKSYAEAWSNSLDLGAGAKP